MPDAGGVRDQDARLLQQMLEMAAYDHFREMLKRHQQLEPDEEDFVHRLETEAGIDTTRLEQQAAMRDLAKMLAPPVEV